MERDPWSQDLKVWENKYFKKSMLDAISNREKKKKKQTWEPGKWDWEVSIREKRDLNSFLSSVEALRFQVNDGSGRKWMGKMG